MKPLSISRLIKELRRRRVFRGFVVYGASTLILFEAAQNLYNAFGVAAVPKWLLLLLAIGFFVSLWFSWIYDITPGGIRKTEPVSDQPVSIPKKEISLYKTTTFVSVLIIIGLVSYRIIDSSKEKRIAMIEKSIAVLPLPDEEIFRKDLLRYQFIGHEITTCLLKVKDYRVVPWDDSRRYLRNADASYNKMGQDLSAAILVNWEPHETIEETYLSIDLVSAHDSDLLWSENYRIKGSWPTAICRHSRKISKKITRELRTYLTPKERALISEQPISARATMYASLGTAMTRDAWEKFRTGDNQDDLYNDEYMDSASFEKAIGYFTEAIKEDPDFASAYANRAKARLWGIRAAFFNKSVLGECEKDITKAFELEPNLPDAHSALGFYYYYGTSEFLLALLSFEKAAELSPGDPKYVYYLSNIHRALGNWKEVQFFSEKVFDSNPRNALFLTSLGLSFLYLHDATRAIECQNRAITLKPHWSAPYSNKMLSLISIGKVAEAKSVAQQAIENTGKTYYRLMAELDLYDARFQEAIFHIEQAKSSEYSELRETEGDMYLLKGKIYHHAGDQKLALHYFNSAADYYQKLILFNPGDFNAHSRLGLAYAGLGLYEKALEHGEAALNLSERKEDALFEPYLLYNMIQICAISNHRETALMYMEELLGRNSPFTRELLKLDPDLKKLFQ